jgi:hypothetical protein
MGDDALRAEREALTNWFRAADKTSALVGQRQASTFLTLAALAGHGNLPALRASRPRKDANADAAPLQSATPKTSRQPTRADRARTSGAAASAAPQVAGGADVGLTVRIEVNLPPSGDASTYDAIFASIKKHLMP